MPAITGKRIPKKRPPKAKLALLIAAHNEELVLGRTIRSAIAAGMQPEHIYVVDDDSNDATRTVARAILNEANVMRVRRSGKGLALGKAIRNFQLTRRYSWVHIADADGAFAPNYFRVFRQSLRVKYAAATGYVRSLDGGRMTQYRVYEYTTGLDFARRFQALAGVISVIPGPTSCFRSDVLSKLDFSNHSLTEDFDVTLQIHRKRLGRIQFIPRAIAYTQDPRTLKDFVNQVTRWNRGVLQGIVRHKIGRRASPIDIYLSWQVIQNLLFFAHYCFWVPYLAITHHAPTVFALAFLFDIALTFMFTVYAAARAKRPDILSAFPLIFVLRWVVLAAFLRALIEVGLLRRFRVTSGTWETASRRYTIGPAAG